MTIAIAERQTQSVPLQPPVCYRHVGKQANCVTAMEHCLMFRTEADLTAPCSWRINDAIADGLAQRLSIEQRLLSARCQSASGTVPSPHGRLHSDLAGQACSQCQRAQVHLPDPLSWRSDTSPRPLFPISITWCMVMVCECLSIVTLPGRNLLRQ